MRAYLASAIAIALAASACAANDQQLTETTDEALTQTTRVTCESVDRHYESCPTQGTLVKSVSVRRRLSNAPCREGESFGKGDNYIWVNHGCRAEFDVKVDMGPPPSSRRIRVLSATYGGSAGADFGNATNHVRRKCDDRASCDYRISARELGDPAFGTPKDFLVEWTCGEDPAPQQIYVEPEADGQQVELSCQSSAPASCGTLEEGRPLARGNAITSCDGRTSFVHQPDGNLVLYHEGQVVTATHVFDRMTDRLTLRDGDFVQTARNGNTIWSSGTPGHPQARAVLQDDCNLVLLDRSGRPYWHTNTAGCVEH
jgi:hypothetical protein